MEIRNIKKTIYIAKYIMQGFACKSLKQTNTVDSLFILCEYPLLNCAIPSNYECIIFIIVSFGLHCSKKLKR